MFKSKTLFSIALLLILGFIWGSGYSIARYAMTHGVPPLGYAFWQSLGPACLLSFCGLSKNSPVSRELTRHWRYFLLCGLIGIAIPNTNLYFIASHLPAGILAVLVNTVPLFVYPLALVLKLERFDLWRNLAILIGMTGIVLIINPDLSHWMSSWTFIALLSPLAFALCALYIASQQPEDLDNLSAATGMLIAATLILTPLVLHHQSFYSLGGEFTFTKGVVLMEILLSSAGYLIFFQLIKLAGPVFYSLTGGVVSLTGLFWGFILFHEVPTLNQTVAISCILLAIFLLSWRQSRQLQGRMT